MNLTQRDQKIIDLRADGATLEQIGACLGLSRTGTVRELSRLRAAGVEVPVRDCRTGVTPLWRDRRPLIVEMLSAGKTYSEIATHLACSKGQVASQIHMMRKAGLLTGTVNAGDSAANAPYIMSFEAENIMRAMRTEKASFEAIAKALKISKATARKQARRLGLPMVLLAEPRPQAPNRSIWPPPKRPARQARKTLPVTRAPKVVVRLEKPARPQFDQPRGFEAALARFNTPSGLGIAFAEIRNARQCRWPFTCDDGETRYCGLDAVDRPYCAEHGASAFATSMRPAAANRLRTRGLGEVRS